MSLTIAVTGLNATDNPAPGVPVIRALRAARPDCTVVGLAYDALDPGAYMSGMADHVYLMPYPSQGADVLFARLAAISMQTPIDVLVPCLDAELPAYLRIQDRLESELGIRMFVPTDEQLRMRGKDRFHILEAQTGIRVPKSVNLTDPAMIGRLHDKLRFPVMVKGQFYDAFIAHTPLDVRTFFERMRAKWGLPVIVQEFIGGEEYCIVAVGDGEGGVVGQVAMKKMQLTDKGKAWGGVTVVDPALDTFVADTMSRLKWRGPCELEVMKAHSDSELYLIEVNPRFPAWVYLSVGAGRNLPWAAVRLALGEDVPRMAAAPPGVMFLRHSFDQICTMEDFQSLTTVGEVHRATPSTQRPSEPQKTNGDSTPDSPAEVYA